MKHFILYSSVLLTVSLTFAQEWQMLPNSPTGGYWNHDDIDFVDENTGWLCDISGQIYRTTDGGDSWVNQANMPGTSFRALAMIDEQKGFVGTLGSGSWVPETTDNTLMYKTTDGGDNWVPVTNIPTENPIKGICGMRVLEDKTIVGVGRYDAPAVFIKSMDEGETWFTYEVPDAESLVDLHFFDKDTGVVGGRKGGRSIILYTTDGGVSFTNVATTVSDHIWKIFFLDRMTGYGQISNYAGNAERFFLRTEDGGLTWTEVNYTPKTDDYEGLGIGFFSKDIGWAAGGNQTWETRDGGSTWTAMNLDPDFDTVNRFLRINDKTMYAIGVHVYKYTDEIVGARTVPLVDHSRVKMNFSPNPFRGIGKLTYSVPENSHVSIGVTSIGGRLIELLVDKKQQAGEYTITYQPEYNQKFVGITILAGGYRRNVKVIRLDGGEYPIGYHNKKNLANK